MVSLAKKVILAITLSGAAALIYEVAATQALLYFFNSSTYSISTVLVSFLLGLAIGSLFIAKNLKKIKDKENFLSAIQIITAAYALLILTQYNYLADVLVLLQSIIGTSFTAELISKFIMGIIFLIIPTIMLGASFPLASSLLIVEVKKAGSDVGKLYSWDLFGAIAGSLIAGFIIIPIYGLTVAIIFGSVLNIISSIIINQNKRKILGIFIAMLILISIPLIFIHSNKDIPLTKTQNNTQNFVIDVNSPDIIFSKNSAYGEIRVVNDSENGKTLYINRRDQCSEKNSKGEREIANIVLKKLGDNVNVLNIGLGCGETLSQILGNNNVDSVDVIEINSVVIEASELFPEAQRSLENPKTNLIIQDGAQYLKKTNKKYDAIIIDIENPAIIHSSPLYTIEYFKIIREDLNKNGIFGIWSYWGNYEYEKTIYKSLQTSFTNVAYLKESAHSPMFIASEQKLNFNTTTEEKERQKKLEDDKNYQLNTLDKNILGNLAEESGLSGE